MSVSEKQLIMTNMIIRASAGSGKTYELVKRLLRLLALGEKPETLVALTFTRKAAGEFFSRLLQKLAELAEKPHEAGDYLTELNADARQQCLSLLRVLTHKMDRLRLGTLDSFFATMVQALPFELGITGMGAIMSEEEKVEAHEEVLDSILLDLMRPENEAARRQLVEAWKMATLGEEKNTPVKHFRQMMTDLHELFLECPDTKRWGAAQAIWLDQNASVWHSDGELQAAVATLKENLPGGLFNAKAEAKLKDWYRELANFQPGTPLGEATAYMLDAKRGDVAALSTANAEWMMWKKVKLPQAAGTALFHLLRLIVGRTLMSACQHTQGQARLVHLYESTWQRLVRSKGKLTFGDLTLLLNGSLRSGAVPAETSWDDHWSQLRLDMEYRLNERYDHWLFDEFQDTSLRQWRVLENLVDEVLQDAEARRSFFAVGDLKQSLYLWREAEPELFLGVEDKYQAHRMEQKSLRVSWRSSPQVLHLVNKVFGEQSAIKAALPGALQWWAFDEHMASDKNQARLGYAGVLVAEDKSLKLEATANLLREIQPLARGLSCAILVRSNDKAQEWATDLRTALGWEVVCESVESIATDNPACVALLSLITLASHPGDTLAWEHLLMTPLGPWLQQHELTRPNVSRMVRTVIGVSGFMAAAEAWTGNLRLAAGATAFDEFTEARLRRFLEMAAAFDETGSRDVDAFLRQARGHQVAGMGGSEALQVMTIHKSKGLEFDVVILPELLVTSLDDARRASLLSERNANGEIAWILEKPVKEVLEWDGRLLSNVQQLKNRAAFEGLCRTYVAMTRAKRALYLIHHSGRSNPQKSEAGLIMAALTSDEECPDYLLGSGAPLICHFETGPRNWFETDPLKPVQSEIAQAISGEARPLRELLAQVGGVSVRRTPSGEETHQVNGMALLSAGRESSRLTGLLAHRLFETVPLLAVWDEEAVKHAWNTRPDYKAGPAEETIQTLVMKCLQNKEVQPWFLAALHREIWRERKFDLFLKDEWITGQLDRVVVERNASGKTLSATILDFKTDAVADDAAMQKRARAYQPQLLLYQQAVSRLTGLEAEKIKSALVFTAVARLLWV